MLEFVVVYDVNTTPAVDAADFIVLMVAVALCIAYWVRRDDRGGRLPGAFGSPVVVMGVFVFAVLLTGSLSYTRYSETAWLRQRLRSGAYTPVEGRVEGFVPGDLDGRRDEQWSVQSGGRRYTYVYRSSRRIPGFHQSSGPIREGLFVRIADVDGYIARLEIERW